MSELAIRNLFIWEVDRLRIVRQILSLRKGKGQRGKISERSRFNDVEGECFWEISLNLFVTIRAQLILFILIIVIIKQLPNHI